MSDLRDHDPADGAESPSAAGQPYVQRGPHVIVTEEAATFARVGIVDADGTLSKVMRVTLGDSSTWNVDSLSTCG